MNGKSRLAAAPRSPAKRSATNVRRGDDGTADATLLTMFYTVGDRLLPDPRIARDKAVTDVEKAADDQDRHVIDQAIRVLGRHRGYVSANDVREVLPQVRPSLVGARFLAAARRGDLEEDGSVRANHAAGHARRIVRWRWTG